MELIQQEIEDNTGRISAAKTQRGKPHQPQQLTGRLQTEPHADLSPQKNAPPPCMYSLNHSTNVCPCLYSLSHFPILFLIFCHTYSYRIESVCVVCVVGGSLILFGHAYVTFTVGRTYRVVSSNHQLPLFPLGTHAPVSGQESAEITG